jgi:hypothetical protein
MEHIFETMKNDPGMLGTHHILGILGGIILAVILIGCLKSLRKDRIIMVLLLALVATGCCKQDPAIHIIEQTTDLDGYPIGWEERGWTRGNHEYIFMMPDLSSVVVPRADILLDETLEDGEATLDVTPDGIRLRIREMPEEETVEQVWEEIKRNQAIINSY